MTSNKNLALTKQSNTQEIKRYFENVLKLKQSKEEYPVDLDEVWMLVYSEKGKAVRVLKENFIEDIDYQVLAQNGKNSKGGRPPIYYYLSVSCLEYFIARKVRPVFEVYRQVFHQSVAEVKIKNNPNRKSEKISADSLKRRISIMHEQLEAYFIHLPTLYQPLPQECYNLSWDDSQSVRSNLYAIIDSYYNMALRLSKIAGDKAKLEHQFYNQLNDQIFISETYKDMFYSLRNLFYSQESKKRRY